MQLLSALRAIRKSIHFSLALVAFPVRRAWQRLVSPLLQLLLLLLFPLSKEFRIGSPIVMHLAVGVHHEQWRRREMPMPLPWQTHLTVCRCEWEKFAKQFSDWRSIFVYETWDFQFDYNSVVSRTPHIIESKEAFSISFLFFFHSPCASVFNRRETNQLKLHEKRSDCHGMWVSEIFASVMWTMCEQWTHIGFKSHENEQRCLSQIVRFNFS